MFVRLRIFIEYYSRKPVSWKEILLNHWLLIFTISVRNILHQFCILNKLEPQNALHPTIIMNNYFLFDQFSFENISTASIIPIRAIRNYFELNRLRKWTQRYYFQSTSMWKHHWRWPKLFYIRFCKLLFRWNKHGFASGFRCCAQCTSSSTVSKISAELYQHHIFAYQTHFMNFSIRYDTGYLLFQQYVIWFQTLFISC